MVAVSPRVWAKGLVRAQRDTCKAWLIFPCNMGPGNFAPLATLPPVIGTDKMKSIPFSVFTLTLTNPSSDPCLFLLSTPTTSNIQKNKINVISETYQHTQWKKKLISGWLSETSTTGHWEQAEEQSLLKTGLYVLWRILSLFRLFKEQL